MKKLWASFLVLVAVSFPASAMQSRFGYCSIGSSPYLLVYPLCTVTVYNAGTLTVASIFSDNGVTPLSNPFTATATGYWTFYAADGNYDVKISGAGIVSPFTFANVQFLTSGGGGSGSVTSVGLVLPSSVFSVTGSPVTTSGSLTGAFVNQTANTAFYGPASGAAATPAFRGEVLADMPQLTTKTFYGNSTGSTAVPTAVPFSTFNPMTTAGDIIFGGASGAAARLGIGSTNQVLTVVAGNPAWAASTGGFANPMTTAGDIITGGSSGTAGRLGIGATNQVLTVVAGAPAWAASASGASLTIAVGGTSAGTEPTLNLISGSGITQSCVDNPGSTRVDCTPALNTAVALTNANQQAGKTVYLNSSNGTQSYTASLSASAVLTAYTSGQPFLAHTDTDCSTTCTMQIDGLGVVSVRLPDGTNAPVNQVIAGQFYWIAYDGTVFRLVGNGNVAPFFTLTDAATVTWATAGPRYSGSLAFTVHSGSRTLNVTGLVNGGQYQLKLIQDGTGGEGLILGTGCTWKVSGGGGGAVTLSTGAGAIDILTWTYDGTNCYASLTKNFT